MSDNLATVDGAQAPPTATPDQDRRDEIIGGLRDLADFLVSTHVPLPLVPELGVHITDRDEYDALVALYGFEGEECNGSSYDVARLSFGPVSYYVQTRSDPARKLAERERKVAEREAALRDREAALETAA